MRWRLEDYGKIRIFLFSQKRPKISKHATPRCNSHPSDDVTAQLNLVTRRRIYTSEGLGACTHWKLVNPFSHRTMALRGLSRGITLPALKAAAASLLVSRLADVSVPGGCEGRPALHQVCHRRREKKEKKNPGNIWWHMAACIYGEHTTVGRTCATHTRKKCEIKDCGTAGGPRDYRPLPSCATVRHPSCSLSNFIDLQGGRCGT